jgi:hypothetical protein
MCGPADFDALHTCVFRLTELSAAGLTSYSVYKAVALCRDLRAKQDEQKEPSWRRLPGPLTVEGSGGGDIP